jgi:hypothetical protein
MAAPMIPRGYPYRRPRSTGTVAALLLVALLAADLRGLVDTRAMAAGVVTLGAAVAVGVLDGYDGVLASAFPGPPKPRRKRRPKAAAKPTSRPPAAAAPSRAARAGIPLNYLHTYRAACRPGEVWVDRAGRRYACWAVLAGIGLIESDHGRSSAPGVRAGVNRFGCCAGPMQFNLRNGPPSTWDTWGRGNVYDPRDAIPAAARKLRGDGAAHDLDGALLAYNANWSYVNGVKAQARRYQQGV